VNQKVRRQIKRLYRYLLQITSFGLAPHQKRGKICNVLSVPFGQNGAGLDVKELEAENIVLSHLAIFDRVIGSLRSAVNNATAHTDRKVERSQKKGFDVLRVTLNLARGNIDTNAFSPALASG
jgi:hypothetical protein